MLADLVIVFASVVTVVPMTITFALGRFLSGIAMGSFSTYCPLYINEFSPAKHAGSIGSLMMILSCVGSTLALALALFLPTEKYAEDPNNDFWKVMFGLQGLFALIQLLLFFTVFVHEAPIWLLKHKEGENSLESLKSTHLESEARDILRKFKKEEERVEKDSAKVMKLAIFINVLQQLSGINAILSYATLLLEEYGTGVFIARVFVMFTGIVRFFASLGNFLLIDNLGRKKVLVYGTGLLGVCLGIMGIFDFFNVNFLFPVIVVQVYLAIFVMSSGPVCWIYCGELLSDNGMSICTSLNFFCNSIVVLFFPIIKSKFGYSWTFISFGLLNFAGVFYLQANMKETKGLLKVEIKELFGKGKI
jgi:SP family arabinose:H+ symporter-like MFS transporter